jgi:charged multivesicular body protein 7
LQREKIEETMDAMAEATADAKDVDETIRLGGDLATGVDEVEAEEDLEAELESLVKEVERETVETENVIEKLAQMRIPETQSGEKEKVEVKRMVELA